LPMYISVNQMMEIEVPNGTSIEIKGNMIEVKGSLGTNKREFNDSLIKVTKSDKKIVIDSVKDKGLAKKAVKVEGTFKTELENDIKGVNAHFEKKMRIVFAHFPITVEVKDKTVFIKNIIGERFPRTADIVGSTTIEVKGQAVRVYGISLDDVGQTAANLRKACKIRNKDDRVFQDGLYYELE